VAYPKSPIIMMGTINNDNSNNIGLPKKSDDSNGLPKESGDNGLPSKSSENNSNKIGLPKELLIDDPKVPKKNI